MTRRQTTRMDYFSKVINRINLPDKRGKQRNETMTDSLWGSESHAPAKRAQGRPSEGTESSG